MQDLSIEWRHYVCQQELASHHYVYQTMRLNCHCLKLRCLNCLKSKRLYVACASR